MGKTWGIAGLLLCLAACAPASRNDEKRADASTEELRDNAIAANAAEPPWRHLVRHTDLASPGRAAHPGASRDGTRVAYATTEFGTRMQVAVRDVGGISPVRITANGGDNLFPRISPDGKHVAYASNKEGNFDIYVARIDAPDAPTQVTFGEEDEIAPSWSPDGRRLACSARRPGELWQLVVVDVGTRIKTYLGPGLYPDWSPDAAHPLIAFQTQPRQEGGRSGVAVVHPDGTGLRELVSDKKRGWSALTPRFSPDGRWVAYATLRRSPESRAFGAPDEADDLWVIRTDGSYDTRLTDDLSPEWWPTWGGDRVFFVSRREGSQNVYSVRVKPLEEAP
jgi:Tol biopolymer transport system component